MFDPRHHRKRVRHYHEPGDCHELTFSCFGRRPLLTNSAWRKLLSESIDGSLDRHAFRLVAFVYMPEHVHLLVYPVGSSCDVDALLKGIKQPFSRRVRRLLVEAGSPLARQLTVRERPHKTVFRFWQEGPGYDRNLEAVDAVLAAVDYIHVNPVRRGLCASAVDWKWSSCRQYQSESGLRDPDLPLVHGLPAEFLT